jgi:hypothetical protein
MPSRRTGQMDVEVDAEQSSDAVERAQPGRDIPALTCDAGRVDRPRGRLGPGGGRGAGGGRLGGSGFRRAGLL